MNSPERPMVRCFERGGFDLVGVGHHENIAATRHELPQLIRRHQV
jgi:hypothetical protein